MQTLRFLASVIAAALIALGLSVGAAIAEGPREPAAAGTPHYAPSGLCLLGGDTNR